MNEKLITIATFSQSLEANFVKSRLESEDILCFLADEYTVNTNWFYSNAIGGVKLQVRESDVKKALDILKQNPVPDLFSEEGKKTEVALQCPKCNSSSISYERFSKTIFIISFLLFFIPFPFLKKKYKCKECGNEWK